MDKKISLTSNDAIIFMAITYASGNGADLANIISKGDCFGRLILSAEEIEGGVNRLINAGLISEKGNLFFISEGGKSLLKLLHKNGDNILFALFDYIKANEFKGGSVVAPRIVIDTEQYEKELRLYQSEMNEYLKTVKPFTQDKPKGYVGAIGSRIKIILLLAIAIEQIVYSLSEISFSGNQSVPPIGWIGLSVIFFFSILSIPFVLAFQLNNPRSYKIWRKPRWDSNPFNFRNPVDFFHLAGCGFIIMGIIDIVINYLKFSRFDNDGCISSALFGHN